MEKEQQDAAASKAVAVNASYDDTNAVDWDVAGNTAGGESAMPAQGQGEWGGEGQVDWSEPVNSADQGWS